MNKMAKYQYITKIEILEEKIILETIKEKITSDQKNNILTLTKLLKEQLHKSGLE